MEDVTIKQSCARVFRCMEVMKKAGRQLQREYYADPDKYGTKLTNSVRSRVARQAREYRKQLEAEYLADITTSED